MPAGRTNWREEADSEIKLHRPGPGLKGHELLKRGARSSVGNDTPTASSSIDQILRMLDINLRDRRKRFKPGIGGLFGGTDWKVEARK